MRSEQLTLRSGARTLPATIDLPDGRGPHGAIVPLHPAGDASRRQFLFEHLAGTVTGELDFAVLRYDRRGDDVPLEVQADDAEAALACLRSRGDIDPSRIGLWGFSQGAWVAPLVASRSGAVRFLVLLGSTGVSPAEQMRYGTAFQMRKAGHRPREIERLERARLAVEAFNRGATDRATAQAAVDAIAGEPWFEHAYLRAQLPEAPGWWPDADFDPAPVFARVRVPVLLFYGEEDEWLPVDASIATWRRARPEGDITVVRLPGTAHHPTLGSGRDAASVSPLYTSHLVEWLSRWGPDRAA